MRSLKTITALLLCLLLVMPMLALAADDTQTTQLCEHPEENWLWIIDKNATCTEDGVMHRICKICSKTDSEGTVIKKTGHELAAIEAVTPTCEKNGNEAYWRCKNCGMCFSDAAGTTEVDENTMFRPMTGHDYKETGRTETSCTTAGVITYTCTHDNSHTYTESIPTIAHADNDGDGNCDKCGMGMNRDSKTGVAGFFAKIGMFFRNVFWFFNEVLRGWVKT